MDFPAIVMLQDRRLVKADSYAAVIDDVIPTYAIDAFCAWISGHGHLKPFLHFSPARLHGYGQSPPKEDEQSPQRLLCMMGAAGAGQSDPKSVNGRRS